MDWNKMGAIGSLGSFAIGLIIFLVQIWPVPQWRARHKPSVEKAAPSLSGAKAISWLLVIGFLLASFSIFTAWSTITIPTPSAWDEEYNHLELVRLQTFSNQEVELDGKQFNSCHFINVTFVYRGLKPFVFDHNDINAGGYQVRINIVKGPQSSGAELIYGFLHTLCQNTQEMKEKKIENCSDLLRAFNVRSVDSNGKQ